jgi:hypothetical protein
VATTARSYNTSKISPLAAPHLSNQNHPQMNINERPIVSVMNDIFAIVRR